MEKVNDGTLVPVDDEIVINDWIPFGAGMEGETFISPSHPDLIMKVYASKRPTSLAQEELERTQALQQCGISVPQAFYATHYAGSLALVSQRIIGKKSFSRLAGEHPENIVELARRMASMARNLHCAKAAAFPRALEKYRGLLERDTFLGEEVKVDVAKALKEIEKDETETLLHGDLHFGNMITDGTKDYFIDLWDASVGNPGHDLAMFYVTTHYGCEHSFDFLYHMTWRQALDFWENFKKFYYGHPRSDQEVFSELRNYIMSRLVWFKHPEIQTALYNILKGPDPWQPTEIRLKALGEK